MVTACSHLGGERISPYGPHLILTRSVPAGARYFYTNITDIPVGARCRLIIEPASANAEPVTAECEGREGNELKWRLVDDGS